MPNPSTPLRSLALAYFAAFADKDAALLKHLLAKDVSLRDWTVNLVGRDAVLAEMGRLFAAARSISVAPVHLHADGRVVAAELEITIDSSLLKVVDVLEFSQDGTLRAIRAYRG